uniref:Uncharacterized protein n=1 Tax=viral metagenome TaxID=1070528 RepID=A0A6C0F9N4_9ZZZZ|tara:strand:- start:18338 stop:19066 length:729 start_codon:yes stop_codon:yes gene_type:complete
MNSNNNNKTGNKSLCIKKFNRNNVKQYKHNQKNLKFLIQLLKSAPKFIIRLIWNIYEKILKEKVPLFQNSIKRLKPPNLMVIIKHAFTNKRYYTFVAVTLCIIAFMVSHSANLYYTKQYESKAVTTWLGSAINKLNNSVVSVNSNTLTKFWNQAKTFRYPIMQTTGLDLMSNREKNAHIVYLKHVASYADEFSRGITKEAMSGVSDYLKNIGTSTLPKAFINMLKGFVRQSTQPNIVPLQLQ